MHVSTTALTYAHALDHKQYSQMQTHANANARKRSLRLTRGQFLRANAIAFCALDLKLSGCTISAERNRAVSDHDRATYVRHHRSNRVRKEDSAL